MWKHCWNVASHASSPDAVAIRNLAGQPGVCADSTAHACGDAGGFVAGFCLGGPTMKCCPNKVLLSLDRSPAPATPPATAPSPPTGSRSILNTTTAATVASGSSGGESTGHLHLTSLPLFCSNNHDLRCVLLPAASVAVCKTRLACACTVFQPFPASPFFCYCMQYVPHTHAFSTVWHFLLSSASISPLFGALRFS